MTSVLVLNALLLSLPRPLFVSPSASDSLFLPLTLSFALSLYLSGLLALSFDDLTRKYFLVVVEQKLDACGCKRCPVIRCPDDLELCAENTCEEDEICLPLRGVKCDRDECRRYRCLAPRPCDTVK